MAVAYVQTGGTLALHDQLLKVTKAGYPVRVVAAVDMRITSQEGLKHLMDVGVDTTIYRAKGHAMHGKIMVISGKAGPKEAFVGSANWTHGGLIRNSEFTTRLQAENAQDRGELQRLVDEIQDLRSNGRSLTSEKDLTQAISDFKIPTEEAARAKASDRSPSGQAMPATSQLKPHPAALLSESAGSYQRKMFRKRVRAVGTAGKKRRRVGLPKSVPAGAQLSTMICELNEVRSPNTPGELRLPVTALHAAPLFWGYPTKFAVTRGGKRRRVTFHERRMRCRFTSASQPPATVDDVRVYYYVERGEFRVTSHEFGARGDQGDLAVISFSRSLMECEIVQRTDPGYARYRALCTNTMPGGGKAQPRVWGVT